MLSKIIEVSDGANWGKMIVSQFDETELARKSKIEKDSTVLKATGERRTFATGNPRDQRLVVDLQNNEGALFDLTTCTPEDDLDRHQIMVCPLFLPFLCWLYTRGPRDVSTLPDLVELDPADLPKIHGYRRPGPEFEGIPAIRVALVRAVKETPSSPTTLAQFYVFAQQVLPETDFFFFKTFMSSLQSRDASRWVGAILADSGRFVSLPARDEIAVVPAEEVRKAGS